MFSDLPLEIPLFQSRVQVEFKENKFGTINRGRHVPGLLLDKKVSSESDGLLLLIKSMCVSVVWSKRNFFLFDSHSKNEKGECCPNGFSTVLKFSCRSALESHIVKNYLTVDDGNTQFEIQYIMVTNMNGEYNLSNDYYAFKEKKRKTSDKEKKRKAGEGQKSKCRERISTETQKAKCRKRKATCTEKEKTRKRVANHYAKIKV